MNDEINDGLTDEERAALAEDDGGNDTETTEESANAEPESEEEDAGGDDDGAAAAADDDAAAAAEAEPAAAAEPEPEPAAAPQPQSAPLLVAEAPADADAKLADIATKKADLLTQFDDGDITAREYQTQIDALAKQEREIERALDKAQIAHEMEQQRFKNEWNRDVSEFLAANTQYQGNQRLYRALDQEVKDIANSAEAKEMTGAQILAKAHANLAEAFGFAAAKPAAQPATKPAAAKVPKPNLPPSLHNVPSAQVEDTSGGKYASLDRLANANPLAYEEALAKMSSAERDAYLSA